MQSRLLIREHVRGRWSTPIDGDDITCILREAVRDGLIVPAIDRNWRSGVRISKRYAPQTWPKRAPDPKPTVYGLLNGQYVPLDDFGRLIDRTPYIPVAVRAVATVSRVASSDARFDSNRFSVDSSNGLIRLGDAQAFEYRPDMPDGNSFDIAKTPNTRARSAVFRSTLIQRAETSKRNEHFHGFSKHYPFAQLSRRGANRY